MNIHQIAEQVTELQEEAARIHNYPENFGIDPKMILKDGGKDYTTAIDIQVEKLMKPELLKLVKNSGFLGEETASKGMNNRYIWIVDPTDGTAVMETRGIYYSNSCALIDRMANNGKGAVILGSVYQSPIERQFLMVYNDLIVREIIQKRSGEELLERIPEPSISKGFPEYLGCSFGTSKYYPENPGVKERLENVFKKEKHPINGREYGMINARPASGSSALFCCDIADGNRHFALLFYQKAWDLAVGAVYAQRAGCPVVMFDNRGNVIDTNLESTIAQCNKDALVNVGIFGNEYIKNDVMKKFNQ